ncbi:alkaline phosphatase [Rubinisphaera italica]|uniref:Alkaline phosphatase H n=1 Tax=Rubinisphaera italica TaxID=2527969 RepID=A0A5C5XH20_9PLAN|nr:alkaline phosphatase [Rubinisphaera italica]TWT61435.1 Alkaline phosphatase H precursor [Rubinisphaera italica]
MFRLFFLTIALTISLPIHSIRSEDYLFQLQTDAVEAGKSPVGHWGWEQDNYMKWGTHSNRLIPVYTFGTCKAGDGIDLTDYQNENSPYRNTASVRQIFHRVPPGTVNNEAEYFDQTNIYDIQLAALRDGKKHIILVVFDGMDWQTTFNASTYKNQQVKYDSGRGSGLHFQDYQAQGTSQFGWMVTSPYSDNGKVNVDHQTVSMENNPKLGGYTAAIGGPYPWSIPTELEYLIGKGTIEHTYTDSASSATSMTTGEKTYDAAINIGPFGNQFTTIAHLAQKKNYKIGVVTSVPISHATPAAAYAHNVSRNDYQDLTRDLLGLTSISHPNNPLSGVDVLIGCGFGEDRNQDAGQGENFVPGNGYLTTEDLLKADSRMGGKYLVAQRSEGVSGKTLLEVAAQDAIDQQKRLFGFFGVDKGHLPFQTANGDFNPTIGRSKKAENYTDADLFENPTLSDFTAQAINVLSHNDAPFWLMVEAGDVDWANHDNNLDNSIGAVLSGDAAVKVVTDWVEANSSWDETVMIVTADHGHYFVLEDPQLLIKSTEEGAKTNSE